MLAAWALMVGDSFSVHLHLVVFSRHVANLLQSHCGGLVGPLWLVADALVTDRKKALNALGRASTKSLKSCLDIYLHAERLKMQKTWGLCHDRFHV